MRAYRSFFNGIMHHAYFLNQGETKYEDLDVIAQKNMISNYKVSDFLKIIPTKKTAQVLKDNRILYKPNAHGFNLVTQATLTTVLGEVKYSPFITLNDDMVLNFALYSTDSYFENYSQITAKGNNQLYFFSNAPLKMGVTAENILSDSGEVDTSFLLSVPDTRKLVHQIAIEEDALKNRIDRFSVSNIPATEINIPTSIEKLSTNVQSEKRKGLLGYIRLYVKGDGTQHLLEFDESDPSDFKQYTFKVVPEVTLKFKNRRTFWQYIKQNPERVLTTQSKQPLTKNGFVVIENSDFNPQPTDDLEFPNPEVHFIRKESSDYYSEIYI